MPTPASGFDGIDNMYLQPQYAIDGVAATRYSSGMTLAAGFYFQVDLGVAKLVSGITVDTNVGMDLMDVANGYDVGLSTDGTNFTVVATCAYDAATTEVINFKAAMARYVRFTNKGAPGPKNGATSWMSIHEFDIPAATESPRQSSKAKRTRPGRERGSFEPFSRTGSRSRESA